MNENINLDKRDILNRLVYYASIPIDSSVSFSMDDEIDRKLNSLLKFFQILDIDNSKYSGQIYKLFETIDNYDKGEINDITFLNNLISLLRSRTYAIDAFNILQDKKNRSNTSLRNRIAYNYSLREYAYELLSIINSEDTATIEYKENNSKVNPQLEKDLKKLCHISDSEGLIQATIKNGRIETERGIAFSSFNIKTFWLPDNLTVNGDLYIWKKVNNLPKGLVVNGDTVIEYCEIDKLPDDITLNGSLSLNGSAIRELNSNMVVNGNLYLTKCEHLKTLPNDLVVKGTLYVNREYIKTIPSSIQFENIIIS